MATEYKLSYTAEDIDKKLGKIDNTVLYTEQTLTEEQKTQARMNIDAPSAEELDDLRGGLGECVRYEDFANAVVDALHFYPECSGEENELYDDGYYEKYLDGTFMCFMTSEIGYDISIDYEQDLGKYNIDGIPVAGILSYEVSQPFDFYGIEYSYGFYFPYTDKDTDFLSTMLMHIECTEYGTILVGVYATQETFDGMRGAEVESMPFFIDTTITGTWREEYENY